MDYEYARINNYELGYGHFATLNYGFPPTHPQDID
jgi:hypothetical protein